MPAIDTHNSVSESDYLNAEKKSDTKHEYIEGQVYAMAGASDNHNRITGTLFGEIYAHLKSQPCTPYTGDMKVKAANNFFYPDVMVVCEEDQSDPYYKQKPVMLVEVFSDATRRRDRTTKRLAYQSIPTLQEYVMIEQDRVEIEILRRNEHWQPRYYYLGDDIQFKSIELILPVEAIYTGVDNKEMAEFLETRIKY